MLNNRSRYRKTKLEAGMEKGLYIANKREIILTTLLQAGAWLKQIWRFLSLAPPGDENLPLLCCRHSSHHGERGGARPACGYQGEMSRYGPGNSSQDSHPKHKVSRFFKKWFLYTHVNSIFCSASGEFQ